MSYFGSEKRLLLSISAISSTQSQAIGLTEVDINVFDNQPLIELTSAIGYPIISSVSQEITLEAGWHYCIYLRIKVDGATSTAGDNLFFYISDQSNNQLSSIGRQIIYRDSSALVGQENCVAYINSTSNPTTIKTRAKKVGAAGTLTVNGNTDTGTTAFRSHLLIKAWR
jgi:hypothetical protein